MNLEDAFNQLSPEEIGRNIKLIRKSKKVSQKELAAEIGKLERTIQKYESGEIIASIPIIKEIATALDLPWYEMLGINLSQYVDYLYNTDVDESPNEYVFNTLGDVINALIKIYEFTDKLGINLNLQKPPKASKWEATFSVDGKGEGKYNADFCLFMENWISELAKNPSKEEYTKWKNDIVKYYSDSKMYDTYRSNLTMITPMKKSTDEISEE